MLDQEYGIRHRLSPQDYGLIFKAIMNASKDGIFVTDHLGNVVLVNRASEEMNAFLTKEILGKNVRDLVKEGYYDKSVTQAVLEQGRMVSLIQQSRNGKRILTTGMPIFDDHGKIRFVFVNDRDITLLNKLAQSLEPDRPGGEKHTIRFLQFEPDPNGASGICH